LCVTLVAGTLAEVNQHLSRADSPALEPSEAKPREPSGAKSRDTSRIDAECSMRLYVTPSRLAELCDTLASRSDVCRLTLSYSLRDEFPVSLLRVMRQLPRLEFVYFDTEVVFSAEAVEAISNCPSIRALLIHQNSKFESNSFRHLRNLKSLRSVQLPAKYAHAFLAQVDYIPEIRWIRFEGQCPQQPVTRATQNAIRRLDGRLKVFETSAYSMMNSSILRALSGVRSLEVLSVEVEEGFLLSDAVALSRLKNLRFFSVGFSSEGLSEADKRAARSILHRIRISTQTRSRAELEGRLKKRAAPQELDHGQ